MMRPRRAVVPAAATAAVALGGGLALAALPACKGWHLRDESQVPVIEVGPGLRPVISWTPEDAYQLAVYEGPKDKDGFDVLWSASVGSGYANNLRSPVTYGVPPPGSEVLGAPPLEAGKTYTVSIQRKDPKGAGDGFQNTRHRYDGTKTFVVGGERRDVDLAAERAELLRLHALEREAHLGKDAARLVATFSEDFRNVARGKVTQPPAAESRERLQAYFDRSTFLAWDDLEPPVVRLSRDGTMAYVIVQKLVHVRAPDSTGTPVEERTVFAWTETWEKLNGEWKLTSVTSTDDRS